jgi:thiol:disulfide interchange protein
MKLNLLTKNIWRVATLALLMTAKLPAQWTPIYSNEDAKPVIKITLAAAAKTHKRVILDFGGNWCPDCKVLDYYFHQSPNDALLAKGFLVVHVNIGNYDMNLDVAERYGVPLKRGVPALVVLDSQGRTLLVQRSGEFESMSRMQSESVTEFLKKWMPPTR